jgi:three-Cys-motif partner protein
VKRKDSLPPVWPLEAHTAAKHKILRAYLGAWFAILGAYNGRVLFFDGFAGPGIYAGGEPGSPIIALRTLLNHSAFPRLNCEFVFAFLEPDSERFESLQGQLAALSAELGGWPKNVVIVAEQKAFEDGAREMLAILEEQKARLAPTFAFVDPFGFSGLPLDVICELLNFAKCELFVNFMIDSVNRWIGVPTVAAHMQELFGTDEYLAATTLTGLERRESLLGLYKEQLREHCRFPYVVSFEMIHTSGHTGNYLIYGTRSLTGLRAMKHAMWSVDPALGIQFSDLLRGQQVLFAGDAVDLDPLQNELLEHFRGKDVSVEDIEEYVLVSTPYSASHWNRGALNPLEHDGRVTIVKSPRKKRFTFPGGTVIRFT